MAKFTDKTVTDMELDLPVQQRASEPLRYIPCGQNDKWAIPLTKDGGRLLPALADWDCSSLKHEGNMLDEKFGGVIVVRIEELNPNQIVNVSSSVSPEDQSLIDRYIEQHGISYPIGTPEHQKTI